MSQPLPKQNESLVKLNGVLEAPSMKAAFIKALGSSVEAARYAQSVINTVAAKPELLACTPKSIAIAAITAATLGLSVDARQESYLIGYRNNKAGTYECQFYISYRGFIKLGMQTGLVNSIDAFCVYANDRFEVEYGTDQKIKHVPNLDNPGEFRLCYAVARLSNGVDKFVVLTKKRIEQIRSFSKAPDSPAWTKSYEEQAKSKAIRQLAKTLPLGALSIAAEVDARAETGQSYRDVIDIDIPDNGDSEPQPEPTNALQPGAIDAEIELTEEERLAEEALYRAQSEVVDCFEALKLIDPQCGPMKNIENMTLEQVQVYYHELHTLYTSKKGA